MKDIFAGIDIGGTNTKIGIVDAANMQILKEKIIPTVEYNGSTNCLNRIIDSINELCRDIGISIDDLDGIGFGILGPVINYKEVVPVRGFHWEDIVNLEKYINNFFNPDLIVIAGGISLSGSFLLNKIKKKCSEIGSLDSWMPKPDIELSILGNHAGIFGAALVTKHNLDANQ